MPIMKWKSALLLLAVSAQAQGQTSGCVRDAAGALQCSMQRNLAPRSPVDAVRVIPRADLSVDARRRSNALVEQRRDTLDQQRRQVDEQRARFRQECLDRAAVAGGPAGCSR